MINFPEKLQQGFSLIELLIIMAITVLVGTTFVLNFRAASTNAAARHQLSSVMIADIRNAQSLAVSGGKVNNPSSGREENPCGYGLHYVNSAAYYIYAGMPTGSCSGANRNFQDGTDIIVETRTIGNPNMILSGSAPGGVFYDVFFEPPDPKVYLNNDANLSTAPTATDIYVVRLGQVCPGGDCTIVSVHKSGAINLSN